MSPLTTIQGTMCASLAALKTALLAWNDYQIDAARNTFQQRIDALSGRSQPSAVAALQPPGPAANKNTPRLRSPESKRELSVMKRNVGRTSIHLVDEGQGTPTLFLHGNPDSSEIWSGIIQQLSASHRCIAPDLPGFGRSTAPEDFDYSLEGMAAFVDDLVMTLGIKEPLNLVVHDIGGPFGLAWAVKHPEKVRSVVIMNTVFHADYRWHLFGRLWRTPIVGEIVQALTSRSGFTRELLRASRNLTRAQIHRTYDLVTPSVKRMMLRWYRAANPRNFSGWEEKLRLVVSTKPSLVLWADHDPYISARYASRFGAGTVEHFPDSGHWLPAEAPRQVAERLLRFYGAGPNAKAPSLPTTLPESPTLLRRC